MTTAEIQADALDRAQNGSSTANYAKIIEGFTAKGIPADQIEPRENVLTYNAWRALGRQVRKGEHGVKVFTRVPITVTDRADPSKKIGVTKARGVTVFHISQTDPANGAELFDQGGAA